MKTINEIELACELANNRVVDELTTGANAKYASEDELYEEDECGDNIWIPEAQNLFEDWYNYYLEMIDKCEEVKL